MATTPVPLDPSYLDPATQDQTTIPTFIRQGMDTSNVQQTYMDPAQQGLPSMSGAEIVASADPGKISVYDASKYTPKVRNHEMTHEFQQTRSDGSLPIGGGKEIPIFGTHPGAASVPYGVGDPRNYDYGGEDGLLQLQKNGGSIADLNLEQQADIVSNYKAAQDTYLAKAQAGTLTPADEAAMQKSYEAHHPLIQQLASQPKSFRDSLPSVKAVVGIGKPEPLAPAPAAPGLPYGVAGLGVTPIDPLLGGNPVTLPTGRNVGSRSHRQ